MTLLVAFVVVGTVVLALLGRMTLPSTQRQPILRWSGQDWATHLRLGLRLLLDSGSRRAAHMDDLVDADRRRRAARPDSEV